MNLRPANVAEGQAIEPIASNRRRGLRELLASFGDRLRARWAFRHAARVGTVRLRGKVVVLAEGTLEIGDRVRLDGRIVPVKLACFEGAGLSIGEGTRIDSGSDISAASSVEIGRNCEIGQYVVVSDTDDQPAERHHGAAGEPRPVVIEDDVRIAAGVTVLPGARIGRGSVIGAHALVEGEIPPYVLAEGVSARAVRALPGGSA